ncbi:maleylpyruvate isomerase N-terminal domain-containing protein [Streptomyces sp. NPDC058240]|uniref:maleylpyruvate isomerase N-terminal domain-containing protein n=1 Tax=Streptomyces sp. NPDC058240 TaxID=3346396 RepID=UPI0036E09C10
MEITDHIKSLATEGQLLATAAQEAGTGAQVPTCPDWRVRDLLRHTGMVHRWATTVSPEPPQAVRADGAPEEGSVDCELSGSAEKLCLTLWNRLPLMAVTVTGDPEPARIWCEKSGITWS